MFKVLLNRSTTLALQTAERKCIDLRKQGKPCLTNNEAKGVPARVAIECARKLSVHLPTMYPKSSLPEMFSNYFSDNIMIIRNDLDSQTISALPAQTDSFSGITLSTFEPVTEVMVKHVIMKSAPKTCSLDPIPTPLLLEILDSLLPPLTALINSSLSSGLFPQVFKSAVIFPLLKKPSLDPNELENFRPISILPFISKIIEKLVLVQISHHLSANNLLNRFQSAYRPGHST